MSKRAKASPFNPDLPTLADKPCPQNATHGLLSVWCAEVEDAPSGALLGDVPLLYVCDRCGHQEDARVPGMFANVGGRGTYL